MTWKVKVVGRDLDRLGARYVGMVRDRKGSEYKIGLRSIGLKLHGQDDGVLVKGYRRHSRRGPLQIEQ